MQAVPGDIIAPTEVVGRDRLIERLWAALEGQSLVLTAERRMGKTTVIRKMTAEPRSGLRALLLDVERVSTPAELVERTAQAIGSHLGASDQARRWLQDLWSTLGGTEVSGVFKLPGAKGLPWKTALERLLGGLANNTNQQFVLIWDEFPWALQKIARGEGEAVVVELLDALRGLRQTHPRLRVDFQPDNDTARALCASDHEPLRRLLKLMQRDHYLAQDAGGRFGFRFPLIRRWWRLDLGLGPLPTADGNPAPEAAP